MKRYRFLIFCCLIFGPVTVFSQQSYVDSLRNWIEEHPAIDSQYILTLHRISYRTSEKDIATSFKYYEKVSKLSDQLNFTYGKSLAQINLGILLANAGNYDGSNDAYFRAIRFAEESGSLRLKAICLNNIGENFHSLNDLPKSKEYCRQAIDLNTQLKAWRGIAINYELIQRCNLEENQFIQANQELNKGFPFALRSNDSYIISIYYIGYGKYFAHFNRYDSATYYFSKARNEAEKQNDIRNMYHVFIARVTYMKNLSEHKKIALLDSAYHIAVQTQYPIGIGHSAELLSDIYDEKGNKDSSLYYFHIYRSTYDSIFSENNRRNVIIKESDWMLKRKEIENHHLQELAEVQEKELLFKNALLIAVFVLLGLLVFITLMVYRNGKAARIQAVSEFEMKILDVRMQSLQSQMNPHFIFNSLNSIENFIMQNERREASDYLLKFSILIRTILDTSRLELVPVEKDFEAIRLYVQLEQLRFNHKFEFLTDIDERLFNPEYKVPPMLLQPYVENAIIHGLSQSEQTDLYLRISAYIANDYIVCIIEDNGIGRLQASKYKRQNKPHHESIGIKLTQEKIDIFNLQHNSNSEVKIMDMFDDEAMPIGTKVMVKIKIV